jgi:hypothetical protein
VTDDDDLLRDYFSKAGLAKALKVTERTVDRWRKQRTGPPVTLRGRTPLYKKESARAWLQGLEQKPLRRHISSSRAVQRGS